MSFKKVKVDKWDQLKVKQILEKDMEKMKVKVGECNQIKVKTENYKYHKKTENH